MKKFRFIIATVLAICFVQGAWALSPGGALGGGGKSAQQHPQQEGKVIAVPTPAVTNAAPLDVEQMENSAEAPILDANQDEPKVEIGKPATSEGQAGNEYSDAEFGKIAAEHAQKKEVRRQLKETLKKHREAVKNNAPDSPADDTQLLLYVILAILIPPLAVALYRKGLTWEFWVCLLLTLFFWLPGMIFALLVVLDVI